MQLLWYLIVGCSVNLASRIAVTLVAIAAVLLVIIFILFLIVFVPLGLWISLDYNVFSKIKTWRKHRRPPQQPLPLPKPLPHWMIVATMSRETDEAFYRVIWCDSDPVDDSLHPHVSIVYMLGVEEFGSFWHRITIWRVSTVSGHREFVGDMLHVSRLPFQELLFLRFNAYISKGVVFIHLRYQCEGPILSTVENYTVLLIYDIRFNKSYQIVMDWRHPLGDIKYDYPIAILCLHRRMEQDTVDGWRIRFLTSANEQNDGKWRSRLSNITIDVSTAGNNPKSVIIAPREDMIFPFVRNPIHVVRTSECKFGLYSRHGIYLCDAILNRFEKLNNLQNFLASDPVLLQYFRRMNNNLQSYLINSCPMVLSRREAVRYLNEPSKQMVFVRTLFQPPTILMRELQTLFKTSKADMEGLTADELREETGVNLSGHLPARKRKWWKIWR